MKMHARSHVPQTPTVVEYENKYAYFPTPLLASYGYYRWVWLTPYREFTLRRKNEIRWFATRVRVSSAETNHWLHRIMQMLHLKPRERYTFLREPK